MATKLYNPNSAALKERLWQRSKPGPNGCRDFTGGHGSIGYGYLWVNGKVVSAHRASYVAHKGPIPAGAHVLHRCDRPTCIAIKHLFLGNQASNVADCVKKGRNAKGETNGHAVLTADQVRAIRTDTRNSHVIAKHFGVSERHVRDLQARRRWRHLT